MSGMRLDPSRHIRVPGYDFHTTHEERLARRNAKLTGQNIDESDGGFWEAVESIDEERKRRDRECGKIAIRAKRDARKIDARLTRQAIIRGLCQDIIDDVPGAEAQLREFLAGEK